jgi:hypothetical protein
MARMWHTNQIKMYYNSTLRVSNGYRIGVAKVSQIQGNIDLFTIWTKKFDTCDTLAIPLRGGGCRKISV